MRQITNYYDDSKITDTIRKLARKVTMTYKKRDDIPYKLMQDIDKEYWVTHLTYKGRTFEGVYLMPLGQTDVPRVEYVLNSLFANAHIYDRYGGRIFDFISDFPGIATDFKSAEIVMDSTKGVSAGLHHLFKDDYELYKSEFVKINAFDRIF